MVSAVLDGDDTAALHTGNNGDGFAAVTAERKQKGVELLVLGRNMSDGVFFSFNSISQRHIRHRYLYVNSC